MMQNESPNSQLHELHKKHNESKAEKQGWLWLIILAGAFAFIGTPVYHWVSSDILLKEMAIPNIWDIVQRLLQFAYYWVLFAVLLFVSARRTYRGCKNLLIVYACTSFLRYFFSLLVGFLMLSGWDTFGYDFSFLLLDVAGDWLIGGLAWGLIILLLKDKNGALYEDKPMETLFNFHAAIPKTILCMATVPSFFSLVSRLIYDLFYGAPQSTYDLVWMILYYFCDILSAFVGYLVIFLIYNKLQERAGRNTSDT